MKKRYREKQIIGFLRDAETGIGVKDLSRKHGFSEASYYMERDVIRAEVERLIWTTTRSGESSWDVAHVVGRLGKLARFHLAEAARVKARRRGA